MACQHADAIAVLERVLMEEPDNAIILEEIADNELSLERYDRAERAALRAAEIDNESYTAFYILGFLESQREHFPKSVEFLKKANIFKPNNPEILRCLGWSLFNAGERESGMVTLERALNLDATNTLTLCDLGVAYVEGHNFSKAKALFKRAIDLDTRNTRALDCLRMVQRIEEHLGTVKGSGD